MLPSLDNKGDYEYTFIVHNSATIVFQELMKWHNLRFTRILEMTKHLKFFSFLLNFAFLISNAMLDSLFTF